MAIQTPTATIYLPWHALDDAIQRGPRAAQPDPADVVPGTLYSVTDEGNRLERSDGQTWAVYAPTGGGSGGGAPDPHAPTHTAQGSDPLNVTALAGYSGTATTFLNGTGAFTTPAGGGAGNVVGPASTTDNAVALFDGTTGKLLDAGPNGTISGSLAIGANPAQSGALRLANNQSVVARTVGNNLDLSLIGTNTGNDTLLGNASALIAAQNAIDLGGNYLNFTERGVPPTPNPDNAALYAKDVSGTTQLALQRSTGIASQIATLPIDLATGTTGALPAASLPNHASRHQPGGADAMAVDAAAATGSLRTLGTGANQAAPGNDARFTAAPQAHHTTHEPGGADALAALSASILTSGTVPVARLGAGTHTVIGNSDTGTINNWSPGLVGDTTIQWYGTLDMQLTGFAGGVSGQQVTLYNAQTTAILYCYHAHAGSTQKLYNVVSSGPTPVAPGGSATYSSDGTNWILIAHEQGAWITPSFSAAHYVVTGAGAWIVEAGDVGICAYRLAGRTLQVSLRINGSSVTGTPTTLQRRILGDYISLKSYNFGITGVYQSKIRALFIAGTVMDLYEEYSTATLWPISTNGTNVYYDAVIEVS